MSEFTKMASGGTLEKPLELLDLLKKARDPREIIATADEIGRAYGSARAPNRERTIFLNIGGPNSHLRQTQNSSWQKTCVGLDN